MNLSFLFAALARMFLDYREVDSATSLRRDVGRSVPVLVPVTARRSGRRATDGDSGEGKA